MGHRVSRRQCIWASKHAQQIRHSPHRHRMAHSAHLSDFFRCDERLAAGNMWRPASSGIAWDDAFGFEVKLAPGRESVDLVNPGCTVPTKNGTPWDDQLQRKYLKMTGVGNFAVDIHAVEPVSYTHLTLPTIYSV